MMVSTFTRVSALLLGHSARHDELVKAGTNPGTLQVKTLGFTVIPLEWTNPRDSSRDFGIPNLFEPERCHRVSVFMACFG